MWYFPIIPRFKRKFKSSSTAELLTWHSNQRIHDGQMCHPADSPSWRNIDYRWPAFGSEPRNLQLALSADGINPHNNGLTNRYSCWPVVLVTYNLPPWLCMKRKFLMLTILVSGPHEPGNKLDVFLQPLVDDLKKLWEGGEPNVYDAFTKTFFTLRATLLWTINDFLAYDNLFGCVNKGYLGCPVCGNDTVANYLPYSRKICYQGHRRYLPRHHPYRKKAAFNGQQEFGQPRQPLPGQEVLAQQENIKFSYGKEVKKSKKVDCAWKKKSVFFELEYWKFHHVRHCLDIMHIEKNVCDSLVGTLLNLKHKSKDSEASRLDMMEMGVGTDLAPEVGEKRTYLPPSSFTLTKAEQRKVLKSLSSMKLPYGHSSNIRNCVSMEDLKIFGMKSHDFHVLLQQLLPVAIHSVLPKNGIAFMWTSCIAEAYLKEEPVEFCAEFSRNSFTTAGLPKDQGKLSGPLSAATVKSVEEKERDEAHLHVLLNNSEVFPYIKMHKELLEKIYEEKKKTIQWMIGEHNRLFADWFENKVMTELNEKVEGVSETIRWLAGKPSFTVLTFDGYLVDGIRYFTKERDDARVVQNSGVSLVSKTVQVSSAKDLNPVESDMTFYGRIEEIWELDYHSFKAPLFLCKWADCDRGIKAT
ncbi:uncharacterized protein LOC141695703 [Apium graveolens]|uniref:uncharacterized protein LOC141695703 n=1 Tax=Apium graveolens TaxID=4045 RepID=UPI003D79D65D